LEKQDAIKILKRISGEVEDISLTGMKKGSKNYLIKVFEQVSVECRQKQWIDESLYRVVATGLDSNNLDEIGSAAGMLEEFLKE